MKKKDPITSALIRLEKKEIKLLAKKRERNAPLLSRLLSDKLPQKLQDTLRGAFLRAFDAVFSRGGGVIDKTFSRDQRQTEYKINQSTLQLQPNKRNLRTFSKKAGHIRRGNTAISAAAGFSMGFFGIGLPDIPVFVGILLKNIYETALVNGFDYRTPGEQYFILLLIESALSCGEEASQRETLVNAWIDAHRAIPAGTQTDAVFREQMARTARALSGTALYMKFIQGIPLIGAAGGISDAAAVSQIGTYAALKYERRRLLSQKQDMTTGGTPS